MREQVERLQTQVRESLQVHCQSQLDLYSEQTHVYRKQLEKDLRNSLIVVRDAASQRYVSVCRSLLLCNRSLLTSNRSLLLVNRSLLTSNRSLLLVNWSLLTRVYQRGGRAGEGGGRMADGDEENARRAPGHELYYCARSLLTLY